MSDLRLIEDYLPIEAISAEASREKSVRKGHISTLHLWWARRPLVACRAAVYGALVPANRWVKEVTLKQPPEDEEQATKQKNGKKKGLNRKAAKEFVERLCKYPGEPRVIAEAQKHILEAHAERLTDELNEAKRTGQPPAWVEEFKFTGERVSYDDIVAGRAPRPRVLDMFAGGGAIPLEALRLGCEAFALDLNPVAHIIELCTLVYPQKYGRPDPKVRGMTGPKNERGETTWGGLADEVRYWGNWVLEKVKAEIGDLYPPIPDPEAKPEEIGGAAQGSFDFAGDGQQRLKTSGRYLTPVAYLWTRTVRCKNPACGATVPLVRQTWLCKKPRRLVALKITAPPRSKAVRFDVVESTTEKGLGFNPAKLSKGGNATCAFCGTVADIEYVRDQATKGQLLHQPMAVVAHDAAGATRYLEAQVSEPFDESALSERLGALSVDAAFQVPEERIEANPRSMDVQHYGFREWSQLYSKRQLLFLMSLCRRIRDAASALEATDTGSERTATVATYLAMALDRVANYCTVLCVWRSARTCVLPTFSRQALPMVWDYGEMNPFAGSAGDWQESVSHVCSVIQACRATGPPGNVARGSAANCGAGAAHFDAVITDPPYYDNVTYSNLSDFFYVWLRRTIGEFYPEHFSTFATPKKNEVIAAPYRHNGDRRAARVFYEEMMARTFEEAHRTLKPGAPMAVVYAHKTTIGWATLVDALRRARFQVTEAWPIDTEMRGGMRTDIASLASSIFLVARARDTKAPIGDYDGNLREELAQVTRERVDTLWDMGIAGADLVIACVGAGLRAFTKYDRVEYANGEEVPAEKFLAEVEGVVLDAMMEKLFGQSGSTISAIDPASRFYVLWRSVYKAAEIDAGEAIVFTYAQHVELDGPTGLSTGKVALVEKKKAKYRALDFTERGDNAKLGLPDDEGQAAPLIDILHRLVWLMEHSPRKIAEFLAEAQPDCDRLRALSQTLAGAALSGKSPEDAARLISTTAAEQSALGKLLANWRSVVDDSAVGRDERADRKAGQKRLEL